MVLCSREIWRDWPVMMQYEKLSKTIKNFKLVGTFRGYVYFLNVSQDTDNEVYLLYLFDKCCKRKPQN